MTLPVALTAPPVKTLPPVILPDVLNADPALPVNTLAPLTVNADPVAATETSPIYKVLLASHKSFHLSAVFPKLYVTLAEGNTFPVNVTAVFPTLTTLAVPALLIVTLAFELTTTFDVPDDMELAM